MRASNIELYRLHPDWIRRGQIWRIKDELVKLRDDPGTIKYDRPVLVLSFRNMIVSFIPGTSETRKGRSCDLQVPHVGMKLLTSITLFEMALRQPLLVRHFLDGVVRGPEMLPPDKLVELEHRLSELA